MVAKCGCAAFGRAFLRVADTNPPTQTNGELRKPVKNCDSQSEFIVWPVGVQLQMPLSTAEHPAERDLHEAEHEAFHPRGGLQTESPVGGHLPDEPDVEVADEGGKYHEYSVFLHERKGQVLPTEVVVLHVEGALRSTAPVVELHHLPFAALPVVGQDAAVNVAVEQGGLFVLDECALRYQTVSALGEKGREQQTRQPAFLVVDLGLPPFCLVNFRNAFFQRPAGHGPDVECFAIAGNDLHHLLAVRAAVHPRLVHLDAVGLQLGERPLQGLRLLQLHTGVSIAVLDVERVQVDLRDTGEIAVGFFVGLGRVVFLGRDELVVVVEDHGFILVDHPELQQGFEQKAVQLVVDVELVGFAALHRLHRGVLHCQSAQVAGDGVRAAEAVVRVFPEGLLTEKVHIFQDFTAT